MSYRALFEPKFERGFVRLPSNVQERFLRVIEALKTDPHHPRSGVDIKKLSGGEARRARVGEYRIAYIIRKDTLVFFKAGHRRDFYDY